MGFAPRQRVPMGSASAMMASISIQRPRAAYEHARKPGSDRQSDQKNLDQVVPAMPSPNRSPEEFAGSRGGVTQGNPTGRELPAQPASWLYAPRANTRNAFRAAAERARYAVRAGLGCAFAIGAPERIGPQRGVGVAVEGHSQVGEIGRRCLHPVVALRAILMSPDPVNARELTRPNPGNWADVNRAKGETWQPGIKSGTPTKFNRQQEPWAP